MTDTSLGISRHNSIKICEILTLAKNLCVCVHFNICKNIYKIKSTFPEPVEVEWQSKLNTNNIDIIIWSVPVSSSHIL